MDGRKSRATPAYITSCYGIYIELAEQREKKRPNKFHFQTERTKNSNNFDNLTKSNNSDSVATVRWRRFRNTERKKERKNEREKRLRIIRKELFELLFTLKINTVQTPIVAEAGCITYLSSLVWTFFGNYNSIRFFVQVRNQFWAFVAFLWAVCISRAHAESIQKSDEKRL